ncbi:MAG: ATP-binding cassette domain-containing protein [Acidimicrobiales bacterium]
MPSDSAVTTRALTKRFGDLVAVDHLDLEVTTGSLVAVLGPNGAGKTTLIRMLATLAQPTSGTARVCGHDVVAESDAVRRSISLTGQFAALEGNLTARENLILVARLRGLSRSAARKVVGDLIERFDIAEFAAKLVKSLSGGQRRRVDLAATLVTRPKLVVLDEPTTGLDPRSRQSVWETVRELSQAGVTVLLSTQYLEEADELASEVVLMDHGRTVAHGTPGELKARIGNQRIEVVTVDLAGYERLVARLQAERLGHTTTAERRSISLPAPNHAADLARVTDLVAASGVQVEEVSLRRPTLDAAFLALTGQHAGARDEEPVAV